MFLFLGLTSQSNTHMSNLKDMNTALEKVSTVKDIFTLDFVADRTIKNFQAVSGRKDGSNWYQSEILALMQIFNDKPDYMKLDKMSIWGCLMTAARTGLSIAEGDLDLIPYGKILKADRNYRGMRKQLRNMQSVKFVGEAQIVWKDEEFQHDKLNNKVLKHISGTPPKEPTLANMQAAYVRLEFNDGKIADVVMYNHELIGAYNKSKMKGQGGPWAEFPWEMAKKTVIRRANKIYYQPFAKEIPDDQFAKYQVVEDEPVPAKQDEPEEPTPAAEPEPEQPAPPVQEAKVSKKKSNMDSLLEE